MTTSLDAWRHRELKVTVSEYCQHCETLKADVQKRSNYWPPISDFMSCGGCFTKLMAQISSPVAC